MDLAWHGRVDFAEKFLASHGAQKDPEGPLVLTSVISGHKEYERYRARGISSEEVRSTKPTNCSSQAWMGSSVDTRKRTI